jgi:hypothetical protein
MSFFNSCILTPTSVSSKIYWFITTDTNIYTKFSLAPVAAVVLGGDRCFIVVYPSFILLCLPWSYRIIVSFIINKNIYTQWCCVSITRNVEPLNYCFLTPHRSHRRLTYLLDPKKIQNYMPPILIRATHKNIMYIYVSLFAFSRTLVHIFRDLKLCIIR